MQADPLKSSPVASHPSGPAQKGPAMSNKPAAGAAFWSKLGKPDNHPPAEPDSTPVQPSIKQASIEKADGPSPDSERVSGKPSNSDTNNAKFGKEDSQPLLPNANGMTTKPSQAFRWSDDEEDDIPSGSFMNDPGTKHLAELEAEIAERNACIDDLESEVKESVGRLEALQATMGKKDSYIVKLEMEVEKKSSHILQYVTDLDERERRIEQLYNELDEKGARIIDLETQLGEREGEPNPSQDTTSTTSSDWSQVTRMPEEEEEEEDEITPTTSPEVCRDPGTPATQQAEIPTSPPEVAPKPTVDTTPAQPVADALFATAWPKLTPVSSPVAQQHNNASIPTPRDQNEPIFATAETIKKSAPVPPPPKLKLGIDMAKYSKSSAAKGAVKLKGGSWMARGSSNAVPTIDPDKDVRMMSRDERIVFSNGPSVAIKMGIEILAYVPKYMFMQCSDIANNYWKDNPQATAYTFPEGSMDKEAAMQHIDWMQMHSHCGKVFSIHLRPNSTDLQNLQLCQAARVLGLNNTYVGHFTKHYCDIIRSGKLSLELMAMIVDLAYVPNDPIFDCLANNLYNQRLKNQISAAKLEEVMKEHSKLKGKLQVIEARHYGGQSRKGRKVRHAKQDAGGSEANKQQSGSGTGNSNAGSRQSSLSATPDRASGRRGRD